VASFDRALEITPEFAAAHGSRGNALHGLRQYAEAIASFDRALALRPEFAAAWSDRGNALYGAHAFEDAVESYDRAIALKPDFAEAYSNRGTALYRLQRYDAALASFDQAIQWKPDYAEAYSNRGNALFELREYPAALASFDVAILKKPDYAEAYSNRGKLLQSLRQYAPALESFDRALRLRPDTEYLRGIRLHAKRVLCDWEGAESERRDLEARIERGERVADPFVMLALSGSPGAQKKAAEIFVEDRWPPRAGVAMVRRTRREKIRVGYFSADFRNHAISYAMAELLERHDRSRFEITGFAFGPDVQDAMTARVSAAMDRFVDVRGLLDREVAAHSRELGIDIAVDLMGFTEHCRPGIFAERAAPVQVNYLGYPATMGAAYIDYLIADETLVPEQSRRHYSEKIVYLPDSFQANDATAVVSDGPCSRAAEGLPEEGFVYCCFNSSHKIGPEMFALWMRILAQVEGSVLWLLEDDAVAAANLRKQAARAGIAAERLVFAGRVPLPEHIARQRLADLFLDTLPFNAGATASPALWAGLPVLTLMGETFAGRMGASLLRAVGLPELVTTTEAEYEALAVELARNVGRMQAIREKLRQNRTSAPLFDTARFARHLEAAFEAMVVRSDAGLAPEHIYVARTTE
jgi:predicted O-linked N-acetylglucosamine transferase (SPINDLY family)